MHQSLKIAILIFASSIYIFSQTATLKSTLELKKVNGVSIPYQNGFPVPSFEKQNRTTIDLAGIWKKKRFNADHNISLAERNTSGYTNLINESPNYHLAEFDDFGWEDKEIPNVENTMNDYPIVPEYYQDGVWYRTKIILSDTLAEKFAKLMFYSVNYIADVWVNGEYLGWHEGGYTPFAFDVTSHLKYGEENVFAIRVDNPPWGSRKDIIPFYRCDWFNYTGIIHDVYLEFSNQTSIIRADIVPTNESGNFNAKVIINNSSELPKELIAKVEVFNSEITEVNIRSELAVDLISNLAVINGESEKNVSISGDTASVWETSINIQNPNFWSPQNPNLYVLKVTLEQNGNVIDEFYSQFGVRSVKTEGNKVFLNDQVIFLTGVARHEDHPVFGRSIPKDIIYDDMNLIDTSNINYIRTAHYPNNPYTYLIADRLGLAVMEEIPVWWFDNEEEWLIQNNERHIHEQMFREMVFKDYNRPSVLFWSTSNECKEEANRLIYNQRIVEDLRNNYNDGRLITQSSAGDKPGSGDITQGPLDVAGWTLYFGIFHGSTYYNGTLIFLTQASITHANKPIVDTEFGYWSGEDNSKLSDQVEVFNETFNAFEFFSPLKVDGSLNNNGFLVATTWWCMFDWYSHQHPNGFQSMGLVSMDRQTEKPVYNVLKGNYSPYYENGGMVVTDLDGTQTKTIQEDYSLGQNYPNPFNPTTTINFTIPELSNVKVKLFNSLGEKVNTILDTIRERGNHTIQLDGSNLSSGIYFCKMSAESLTNNKSFESTIKIIMVK